MNMVLQSIRMLVVMTVITGVAYPLLVTGIAQVAFKDKANGSLLFKENKVIGSSLIGQPFSDPRYFWGRPSATSPMPYNGAASSGSNQGPTNPALKEAIEGRIKDHGGATPIPVDLVTASGSGLDPHISPAAAEYQIARVAKARKIDEEKLQALVQQHTQGRQLGFLGEPTVNVLRLNLALDTLE
jgi:K+-transporting ATPase ATPase C chain